MTDGRAESSWPPRFVVPWLIFHFEFTLSATPGPADTAFTLAEEATTSHTPQGWPVIGIDLVPSGKAPKKYGDDVYRFGAALTLSALLPRRGWTLIKQTKNYAYVKPPVGELGPPFHIEVAVPTDAECLAIADQSFARGHSWIAQLGEWPAYYLHEQVDDVVEVWRDAETGQQRSRVHQFPRKSTFVIGEFGSWQATVTGVGGRFAIGVLPPEVEGESIAAVTYKELEEVMAAPVDDENTVPRGVAEDGTGDDEWDIWSSGSEDEYSESEAASKGPIRITLEYTPASEGADGTEPHGAQAVLYAHDPEGDQSNGERNERRVALALVTRGGMTTFPLNFNPARPDFLHPRYGRVTTISMLAGPRWTVPKTVRRFDELLATLPTGLSRYAALGLGLKYEYRFILSAAQELPGVSELAFVHGDDLRLEGTRLVMGWKRFEQLRKGIVAISNRATSQSRQDRAIMVANEILNRLDPKTFPLRQRKLREGEIYRLAELTSRQPKLSGKDMDAAVDVLSYAAPTIAKERPEKLLALKAEIETIALDELIARMEAMMKKDLTEDRWQTFFHDNPFVISLALPYAVVVLRGQAHVGGTRISGAGENIADYLFAHKFTGGLGVVEIKRPSHELVTSKVFRGNVHAPHQDLTSAIAQVLGQKAQLTMNFANKALDDDELQGKNVMSVHCVVVIGTTPDSNAKRKSFDLFRDAVKNVVVLTFDELLARIRELRELMGSRSRQEAAHAPVAARALYEQDEVKGEDGDVT